MARSRSRRFEYPRVLAVLSARPVAVASLVATVALSIFLALRSYEVDIDVYLMGGRHAFSPDLYTVVFKRPFLAFTYPPFAALAFAAFGRLPLFGAQVAWALVNDVALVVVIALSIALARPQLDRALRLRLAAAASLPAMLLNPVFLTIGLGQINLLLCVAVLWDLLGSRRVRAGMLPIGVITGIAGAVKLTPLIFLAFLAVTGRWRGAVNGAITFAVCSLVSLALNPAASLSYFGRLIFEPGRAGALLYSSDQNLASALDRFHHARISPSILLLVTGIVALAGLGLAAAAYRRSSPFLAVLVCATTELIVSPITWAHHLVWIVPALAWFAIGADRPAHGRLLAGASALLFWAAPIWWVPRSWYPSTHPEELAEAGWQLVAGNSFFLALALFLVAVAAMLIRDAALRRDETRLDLPRSGARSYSG